MNIEILFYQVELTNRSLILLLDAIYFSGIVLKTPLSFHAMLIPAIKLLTLGNKRLFKVKHRYR